jgi:ATP-dependent Clp protease protease subunit
MKPKYVLLLVTGLVTLGVAAPLVCHTAYSPHTNVLSTQVPVPRSTVMPTVTTKVINHVTLSKDNTVLIMGEIGSDSAELAQEITSKSKANKTLYVLIDSPGGSVLDGAMIVSAIQAAPGSVVTICSGLCASMASIIFESGTKRLMVDRSLLMFHAAAGGFQGTFPQIQNRFAIFNSYVTKFDYEIAQRAGVTLEQFMSKLNPEFWLDSEDAVNQKYADGYVNILIEVDHGSDHGGQENVLKNRFGVTLGN